MRRILRAIKSTILWSYERGSWPYDFMVVLIVLFVLVTPRSWFHDQPQNGNVGALASGIVLENDDPATHTETFRVDSWLFGNSSAKQKRREELEKRIHELLSGSVDELKSRSFQIRSIQPVRGSDGSVMYYEVEIRR
ncbi:MAG TPA: hypothetical protein VFU57_01975 [Candidatus Acidoferrales bacterium]|nr:hypothetical protein [Candidatus Acidoferrales bacterium]